MSSQVTTSEGSGLPLDSLTTGDKIRINDREDTFTVEKENLLDYVVKDSEGTEYSLHQTRVEPKHVVLDENTFASSQIIVRELEVVENAE